MKIKRIIDQHRQDFTAIYECEHCGKTQKSYGYDDDNFYRNVIPKKKCKSCGKTADNDYRPLTTKYAPNEVV